MNVMAAAVNRHMAPIMVSVTVIVVMHGYVHIVVVAAEVLMHEAERAAAIATVVPATTPAMEFLAAATMRLVRFMVAATAATTMVMVISPSRGRERDHPQA
jgi:hypothetical protein